MNVSITYKILSIKENNNTILARVGYKDYSVPKEFENTTTFSIRKNRFSEEWLAKKIREKLISPVPAKQKKSVKEASPYISLKSKILNTNNNRFE